MRGAHFEFDWSVRIAHIVAGDHPETASLFPLTHPIPPTSTAPRGRDTIPPVPFLSTGDHPTPFHSAVTIFGSPTPQLSSRGHHGIVRPLACQNQVTNATKTGLCGAIKAVTKRIFFIPQAAR